VRRATLIRHPGEGRDLVSRRHGGSHRDPGLRRDDEAGFTLVELLVSLFIFAMLSAAGVALLSFSVRSQEATEARLGRIADLRRAGALLAGDLAQAAPRSWRDEAGAGRAAFDGSSGEGGGAALIFVRRGWENLDDSPRPSLQRVEYRLVENRLERRAFPYVDGAAAKGDTILLEGVRRIRLRYRDREGEWRDRWDPTDASAMPTAVEAVVGIEDVGQVRQLFQVGAGA